MKANRKKSMPQSSAGTMPRKRFVEVGDLVRRHPQTFDLHKDFERMEGRVVYVHPLGRFHVVEFPGRLGAIRESFFGVSR